MNQALKSNLTNGQTWMRLVYMIVFAAVFGVAQMVVAFVVLAQFAFKLFGGEVNPRLAEFGDGLAQYFRHIVSFMTFHAEDKPFPFAPWPQTSPGAAPPDVAPPSAVIET